jgi:hypothetical protein
MMITPMLVWYYKRILSTYNIDNGIKEHTHGYQIITPIHNRYFMRLMSRGKNLCMLELVFGSIPFYNHTDIRTILPKYEESSMPIYI